MRRLILAAASLLALAGAADAKAPAYAVTGKLALPDGGWDLASFDPAMRRVYIARSDAITAIDVDTGQVTGKLARAYGGHAAVAINGGREVMVTSGRSNTADVFDAKTGAAIASIKVGEKPDAAMLDAATGLAVVMNAESGDLSLIDPAAHAVVATIPVGGSLELGASDGTGRIFVNVEDKNEVVAVDLKARKVLRHYALAGCDGPTGVAWLAVSRRVLSACANGVAAITDPETSKVQTLPIGQGPDTALYDAGRKLAFVPTRSGELDIFADDAAGVTHVGKVATQRGARTGALDPKTGRLYLPAADYAAPAAPAAGRKRSQARWSRWWSVRPADLDAGEAPRRGGTGQARVGQGRAGGARRRLSPPAPSPPPPWSARRPAGRGASATGRGWRATSRGGRRSHSCAPRSRRRGSPAAASAAPWRR